MKICYKIYARLRNCWHENCRRKMFVCINFSLRQAAPSLWPDDTAPETLAGIRRLRPERRGRPNQRGQARVHGQAGQVWWRGRSRQEGWDGQAGQEWWHGQAVEERQVQGPQDGVNRRGCSNVQPFCLWVSDWLVAICKIFYLEERISCRCW